jgi:hypothetical protein
MWREAERREVRASISLFTFLLLLRRPSNINSTSTQAHFRCYFSRRICIDTWAHLDRSRQLGTLSFCTSAWGSSGLHPPIFISIFATPRSSMDETERRTVKRSRFDQTEPEPKRTSRFDRRSRSPPSRRSEPGRDRSPIAKDATPEARKSPTDAAAAAGLCPVPCFFFFISRPSRQCLSANVSNIIYSCRCGSHQRAAPSS